VIFKPVYTRERIEELRSRTAILKSSLLTLKQTAWAVFKSFSSKNCPPPYLFPACSFSKIESQIEALGTNLATIDPESVAGLLEINNLTVEADNAQFELIALQRVFTQRSSSVGMMKLVDFPPIQQMEFGTILKAYNAVDALTFELVQRTLGPNWIKKEKYAPICLFDNEYMINVKSYIISVPYYDSFRSRFWSALAHEVGHVAVRHMSETPGPFKDLMLDCVSRLMEVLEYEFYDQEGRKTASLQMSELASDIISAYVCPTSYLTGAYCLDFPNDQQFQLTNRIRYSHHPPTDSRLSAMRTVLEINGILQADPNYCKSVRGITEFLNLKNLVSVSMESNNLLKSYSEFAETCAHEFLNLIPQIGFKAIDGTQWNLIGDTSGNGGSLTPVQLICLTWMKRLKTTSRDGGLTSHDYIEKRRTEPKIFEEVISLMYKYYQDEMCKKATSGDLYDICIGSN
jgi:hypothetical protein